MSLTTELFNQRAEILVRFDAASAPALRQALVRLALQEHLHLHRLLLVAARKPVLTVSLATRQLADGSDAAGLVACRQLFLGCRDFAIAVAERIGRGAVRGRTAANLRLTLIDIAQVTDRALVRISRLK